jgi:hypothetical protein
MNKKVIVLSIPVIALAGFLFFSYAKPKPQGPQVSLEYTVISQGQKYKIIPLK